MVRYNVYPDDDPNKPANYFYFTQALAFAVNGDTLALENDKTFTINNTLYITKNIDFESVSVLGNKPRLLLKGTSLGLVIQADGVSIKNLEIYYNPLSGKCIEITGTTINKINKLDIQNCIFFITDVGISINGIFNNTKNSSVVNIIGNNFNRYNNSNNLLKCIQLSYFDSNIYIRNNKSFDELSNSRFIYVNTVGGVATKKGSINLLANEFLNASIDAFYYQDNFNKPTTKSLNVIFVDDRSGFNKSNSRYFIYLQNSSIFDMDIFNNITVRNNYVSSANAYIILHTPTAITKNFNKMIKFTDDNQGFFSSFPGIYNVNNQNFLAYIAVSPITNPTLLTNLSNLYESKNKITVPITLADLKSVLEAVKTGDKINIEDRSIINEAFRYDSGINVIPKIEQPLNSLTVIKQDLAITNAVGSVQNVYLLGIKEPVLNSGVVIESKPVVSTFYAKGYDSTLEPINNINIQTTIPNIPSKPFVNLYRLNEDTNSYVKYATAFRTKNTKQTYSVNLTNQSEYSVVEEEDTGALGDPYIKSLDGKIYKLPDENNIYRLLETDTLIINGQTRILTEEEQKNTINNSIYLSQKYNLNITPEKFVFDNMCFFDKIYINNEGKELLIDINTLEIFNNGIDMKIDEYADNQQTILPIYQGLPCKVKEFVWFNKILDWIGLRVYLYDNLQIRNGVSLYLDRNNLTLDSLGLFKSINYPVKLYSIDKINNISSIRDQLNEYNYEFKKITEKFYRNDGQVFNMELLV